MTITRYLFASIIYILFSITLLTATTPIEITGNISGFIFKPSEEIYIAEAKLIVPPQTSVTIPEGTIILFKNKTGLFIEGTCEIKGTSARPVIFTSYNDSFNDNPITTPTQFDWTGIKISKTAATVAFNHLIIKYAVKPIESLSPEIICTAVRRVNTMEESFTINSKQYPIKSNSIFNFPPLPTEEIKTPKKRRIQLTTTQPTPPPSATPTPPVNENSWWKSKLFRIPLVSTGSIALIGSGGCVFGYVKNDDNYNNYYTIYSDTTIPMELWETDRIPYKQRYLDAKNSRNAFMVAGIITGSIGMLLLSLFGLTFYF